MVKEGLSEAARQMLARLRPDRRMSLAIGLGVVACFALAYNDALEDLRPPDPSLPADAVRRLPDGRVLLRDGSISDGKS